MMGVRVVMWLSEEELENLGSNLITYLHGKCDEWVLGNYKDSDKILVILEFDYNINRDCLLHCCLIRDGNFIDVRGETSNLDDVLDGFDYDEYSVLCCENKDSFKTILKRIGVV